MIKEPFTANSPSPMGTSLSLARALPISGSKGCATFIKDVEIQAEITDGWLAIAGIKVAAKTSFFADDSILRSVNLPLNYNDADLLRMSDNGFTTEELAF
jgi:hypothetical protein